MSDYKQHIGKIKLIKPTEETLTEYTKRVFGKNFNEEEWNKETEAYWLNNMQKYFVITDTYDSIFFANKEFYVIVEREELKDYDDICILRPTEKKDTFFYVMRFYNGGTCLSEMIKEALDKKS